MRRMNSREHPGGNVTATIPSVPHPLIHGLLPNELAAWCQNDDHPLYRSRQIWRWLYRKRVDSWEAMRNLPVGLRTNLGEAFEIQAGVLAGVEGTTGKTRKLLVALQDGEQVEAVLIPARNRRTVCVSSQVGCRFHCAFCASGQAGFDRNLEAGEMVGQVIQAAALDEAAPTHVVFMGIGEPFDNYDAVLKAVRIINDGDGLAIGARRITISTCGIPPGIKRLAEEKLQVELSVSLHAPDDACRSGLMPVNGRYPLSDLMASCRAYTRKTGRIVTFEYTLIGGVNDSRAQAEALARRLSGFLCRVNLIPLSSVPEFEGRASSPETAEMFTRLLKKSGVNATFRHSRGSSLKAACGQLRYSRT